jgi:hypothetical protein
MYKIQILEREILFSEAVMKKLITSFSILFLLLALLIPLNSNAATIMIDDLTLSGNCAAEGSPEDFYWELGFNDEIPARDGSGDITKESFYTLEAPCKVFFGDTFEIRVTATDNNCIADVYEGSIAGSWFVADVLLSGPPVVTTVASGNMFFNDINVHPTGVWQKSYMRPTPTPDNHDITFNVTDLGNCDGAHNWTTFVHDSVVVDPLRPSDENSPPDVYPVGEGLYEMGDDLMLGATVSDSDGDKLSYQWFIDGSAHASGNVQAPADGSTVSLPNSITGGGLSVGTHDVTLTVSDGTNEVENFFEVEYAGSTAPTLSPVSDTAELWPPNNDMLPVRITANAADNSGVAPSISVKVTSNTGTGGYSIENIDQDTGVIDLQLRASNEKGSGYTVTIEAEDGAGNTASADVVILVAENRRGSGKGLKKGHK